jgi:predicted negative regulator of RcsB-dependent stress response
VSAYTDQEEIEKLKEWWKNYGGALLIGVLLGLGLLFGYKYWTRYQEQQRTAASTLYTQMLQEVQQSKNDAARANGKKLMDDYTGTPYAGMAALMLARLSVEANDQTAARQHLQWAIDHAADTAVQQAARLRLGQLYVANREYDAALSLVQTDAPGFEAEYLELQGDAYAGLGKTDEARAAYSKALKALAPNAPSRRLLQMKLDDLAATQDK